MNELLLAVAVKLFAKKGYEGVAVDKIVEAAGVNKRMIHHYFGSKEGICAAVLEQAVVFAEDFPHKPPCVIERRVHSPADLPQPERPTRAFGAEPGRTSASAAFMALTRFKMILTMVRS